MRIFISPTSIYFLASKELSCASVIKRSLSNDFEFMTSQASDYLEGICQEDECVMASFPLTDFNALTETLILRTDFGTWDYSTALNRFRLDHDQMDSHYYVTVNLFGAGMNRLEGNDLLYQALCYLEIMPPSWQFYGGLITLISFRISENLKENENLLDSLINKHYDLIQAFRPISNHSVRWLISSSFNLAVVCLYLGRNDDVEMLLERALTSGSYNRIFPLTYMNYAQMLLLAAAMKFAAGRVQEASHLFLECAEFSSYALGELFNLRNEFLLRHEMDSRVIMDVGYVAYKAGTCLTNQRFASDSKLATININLQEVGDLDFSIITRRYSSHMGYSPSLLHDVANKIRAYKH